MSETVSGQSGNQVDSQIEKFKGKERKDTSLVPKVFMSREDVGELAERIRMMVPNGETRYSPMQALTLAQAALAHGLSPFNGEIYLMVDREGVSRGLVIGVKGIRKHARRQARRQGMTYDIVFEHVTDPDEYGLQAPQKFYSASAVVVRATLTLSSHVDKWLVQLAKFADLAKDFKAALEVVGPKPQIVAYGIFDPEQENYAVQKSKNKTSMSPMQKAKKRAESGALKEAFDLPFGLEYDPNVDEVFDGEVNDYGPDDLEEGPMTLDVDEDHEEWEASKARAAQDEDAEGTLPKSKEEGVSQLGFGEDRFTPDTSRKQTKK